MKMLNRASILTGLLIIGSLLLSGCSRDNGIDQLSSEMQSFGEKLDQISSDVGNLRSDVELIREDADRANRRLDNQVSSYRK